MHMTTDRRHVAGTAPKYRVMLVACPKDEADCSKTIYARSGGLHYHKVRVAQEATR